MISSLATAFAASFLFIFLKATQQRQVMLAQYSRMPLVSIAMSFCEVFVVANVAKTADSHSGLVMLALAIGIGGGIGGVLGTYMHAKKHGGVK